MSCCPPSPALGEALCRFAQRVLPSQLRYDDDGQLRVIAYSFIFVDVTAAFNQIRRYGRGSAAVMIRLLEAMANVAAYTTREEARAALLQQASMVRRGSQEAIPEEWDRQEIEAQYRTLVKALKLRRTPC